MTKHASAPPPRPAPESELLELARAEEARLAGGFRKIADEARDFAGGVMCRATAGSWANAAVGCGLSAPLTPDMAVAEVDSMIGFYRERAIEPRVELCPYADIALTRALALRGFVPSNFEHVMFRTLSDGPIPPSDYPAPPGLRIRAIDPTNEADIHLHASTAMLGFMPPGTVIPEALLEPSKRSARHPTVHSILAEVGGEVAGAGSMEAGGPVAALFGLTVLPAFRRRGIQRAMIDWRLKHAAEMGCRWATIGTRPGQATERNVRRVGFEVAYTKVTLVRPGPGLTPVTE
jgi:GNAT superfamily N-acetyltransferase